MSNTPWMDAFPIDESIVMRNGASSRTADELKVCFISDAIDVIEDLHERAIAPGSSVDTSQDFRRIVYRELRSRYLHAEEHHLETVGEGDEKRLSRDGFEALIKMLREWSEELDGALVRDPVSGNGWFDTDENGEYTNTEMPDPGELDEDLTSILSGLGVDVFWEDGFIMTPAHPEDCKGCDWGMVHDYMKGE